MACKISCYAKFKEYFSDDSFSSFDEFNENFQKFQDATFSLYRICDSNPVETDNARRKSKLSLCLRYASVSFCCVYNSGQENGAKNKHFLQNCQSVIRLSASARDQQLRIVHANLTHNHILSSDLYKTFKKEQLLAEKKETLQPNDDLPNNGVKAIAEKKVCKSPKVKEGAKVKGKVKKNGAEELESTLRTLEQNKEAKFIVDEATKQYHVVALATSQMKLLFERFPDAIFIDMKSKPNKYGFFLYQIVIEDEAKHSRTVLYVFVKSETKDILSTVLDIFLELFPNATNTVKTVMLGMGFQQLQHVQRVLPLARILWCQFRVLRLCKKRINKLPISFTKKQQLFLRLREAMMAEEESMFIAATEQIKGIDSTFFDLFQEEWLPSVEFWSTFERRNLPLVTNMTNILNQELLQRALASSTSIGGVIVSLMGNYTNSSPGRAKEHALSPEVRGFLKQYGTLEASLMRKNFSKLKCLTLASEETEEHVQVIQENGLNFIVRIDGEVIDCNCTFNSRYTLPCRHIIFSSLNLKLNLIALANGTVTTNSPPQLEPQGACVAEDHTELLLDDKVKRITDITSRMNRTLGNLGTVHFQKWMKVLQELKTIIETEFTENCNGHAHT